MENLEDAQVRKEKEASHGTIREDHPIGSNTDPWQHRASNMKCKSCMWYVMKVGLTFGLGRCRRHAPVMSGYPVVFEYDWCGDHKLNEGQ